MLSRLTLCNKFCSTNMNGVFSRFKQALRAPVKYIKRSVEPSPSNYTNTLNTTEEAFDEVAQEWQALLVNNPHDVQTYNQLEQVA